MGVSRMDWQYLFFSFDGRIGRQTYWLSLLALFVISLVAMLIDVMLGTFYEHGYGLVSGIVSILSIYSYIAVYAKRWHDRNKSGWWTLIVLVPVIGGLWMLIECGFLRGTDGPNDFGSDPLAG
jgi:uncharacterized membrane protein YhaH (DUF805 family)